jgi:hypothetical protein
VFANKTCRRYGRLFRGSFKLSKGKRKGKRRETKRRRRTKIKRVKR